MTEQQRSILRDLILNLSKGCPLEKIHPAACPIEAVRLLPLPERVEWINGLKDHELDQLFTAHCACQRRRRKLFKQNQPA